TARTGRGKRRDRLCRREPGLRLPAGEPPRPSGPSKPRDAAEVQIPRGERPDRFALPHPYRRADVGPPADRRSGRALPAAEHHARAARADRAEAADDREQHGRTEALEEMAVDLAGKPRRAVETGRRRREIDRHSVGPDQPGPDDIGTLLAAL